MRPETGLFDEPTLRDEAALPRPAPALRRPPIPAIVQQHADDALHLRHVRSVLVRAPHVRLLQLQRLDDRLEAHLDGLAVAGDDGLARAQAALERLGTGEVFAALVAALQAGDQAMQQRLFALASASPEAWRGVVSALGWVTPGLLRAPVRALLASPAPWQRALALEACRMHRVAPGAALPAALRDGDAVLRLAGLRAAGELGRSDLLPLVLSAMDQALAAGESPLAEAAASAACLLGERHAAVAVIERAAFATPAACDHLRPLAVQLLDATRARDHLRALARQGAGTPAHLRETIRAIGWLGDAAMVPWLIERMDDRQQMRVAGEAFTTITGADLALLDLEQQPPTDHVSGPNDDPDDDDVALDDDESLPWPDKARVQQWWQAQAARFGPGQRWFVGGPVQPAHLHAVLQTGTQRQRALAARYQVLLQPGQPLFPIAAPVWRQKRLLAAGLPA
ncbi:TIGR02270 family protein [Pseudorhodoferax sp. Leaf267]|uniref:TIGR02270 family protein n=1 Tax=Pseudorhodoferax sp. Leaf267 TaxID=1736316 RepID=UPI0006FD111F|nr:TIGR02270 family protein [Pseudorhodoferax sp. Leaf267]